MVVYGENTSRTNTVTVHELGGRALRSWRLDSPSVVGFNAIVILCEAQRLLAVVSTQRERQIDLYDLKTGQLVRHCNYNNLDPGVMSTGCKGQILVVDRSTDPWRIAILDTTKPELPVVKFLASGIRQIWGLCFAETSNRKIVFASSYTAQYLVSIDAESGQIIWKLNTPTWGPYRICKSVKGCLFVTNIDKLCNEVFVLDFNGNFMTTLTWPNVRGILDVHCLSNARSTLLVLGHIEKSKRSIRVFELDFL